MAGYFQKTTSASSAVSRIKHSSDYSTLQTAFDDLSSGDILYINKDYTLTSTVDIVNSTNNLKGDVKIIGYGSVISPSSNNSPSELIRLQNSSVNSSVSNIVISGLRFKNNFSGAGSGTGLVIIDNVQNEFVYHIKLEDLKFENFRKGLEIRNAFDIVIDNIYSTNCENGIRLRSNVSGKLCGQIKLFGGWLVNNTIHIQIEANTGLSFDHIELFGTTFGHRRPTDTEDSIGVNIETNSAGVFAFGCHFEELKNIVNLQSGVFLAATSVQGCKMLNISDCCFNYSQGSSNVISINGNLVSPSNKPILKSSYNDQGLAVLANSATSNNAIPDMGVVESALLTGGKSSIRISTYTSTNRPSASNVLSGTLILNSTTGKLNVSNGSGWFNADGSNA